MLYLHPLRQVHSGGPRGQSETGIYAITSIHHSASEPSYGSDTGGTSYDNIFTCIPDFVAFRPALATPKPMSKGHRRPL